MAEASYSVYVITIIAFITFSLILFTIRSNRNSNSIIDKTFLHTQRNLIIGILIGVLLVTVTYLDPIFDKFEYKLPWIIIPIILLSFGFLTSIYAVDLIVFQTLFRIRRYPVNEDFKSLADGILLSLAYGVLLAWGLQFENPLAFKSCCG